jgi:hypothetical protein
MSTTTKLSCIAAVACAVIAAALPAAAQETPYGACVMKAVRQEQADRKACNDKHGTTVTPERSACFKKVTDDKRAADAQCKTLPNEHKKK